uniref:Uncharacterized protein n=1 Tax=Scylla olivacea TaxID=85551 RepID=A0A0P4VWR1_SCYOL
MVFQHRSSTLTLGIMRVMGWFPYQWGNFASLHITQERRVPRSWPWFTWSLIIGTLNILLCFVEIHSGFETKLSYEIPTLKVTRSLYCIYQGVLGFVMCVYALVYSPRLAMAVSHAHHICHDLKFPAGSVREVLILLSLFLHIALILLLCSIEVVHQEAFSPKACANILTHVFKNAYLSLTVITYNNCIYILTAAYSRVTERITGREHTTKFESKRNVASITSTQHEASEDVTDEDYDNVGRRLLGLQVFHHQVNRYFGPAIVMVVAYCMFTSIVSFFYLSLFLSISWKSLTFTCVYMFLSTQPLILLNNSPVQLNTKVSHKTPNDIFSTSKSQT